MIKSYWMRLALFVGAGALLALAVSMALPKKYEAVLQILIDQKIMSMQPASSPAEGTVIDLLDASRGRSITTQVEQLISFKVLGDAADSVARARGIQLTEDSELHPVNLQNAILVGAEATSDLITLRVRMSEAKLAEEVANGIFTGFRDLNERNAAQLGNSATASLQNQYDRLTDELQKADQRLRVLRESSNTPNVDVRVQSESNNLSRLKELRDQAEIEYISAQNRVQQLEAESRKMSERVYASNTETVNPTVQRLEQEILMLRAQRDGLLDRYQPDHERVQAVESQIRSLRNDLIAQERQIKNSTSTQANPNLLQLTGELAQARAVLKAMQGRVSAANSEVATLEGQLKELPKVQMETQELLRQQIVLERNRADVQSKLAILEAAQRGRTAPVQLVTPPTALPNPVSPKPVINILFGMFAGLIFGVLSMLATEGKRQPVRSLAQLNALAFQPVYRIIPELRQAFRGVGKAPAESYETLLVNFRRSEKRPYRVGVVGITKDSGSSTTALNMALAADRHGYSSVVVESDPRHPIRRMVSRSSGGQTTGDMTKVSDHVNLLSPEVLNAASVPAEVQKLERELTVFDFEPTTVSAEYAFAASNLDEIIVLVRAGRVSSVDFLRAQQALADSGCPVVTIVFSRTSDLEVIPDAVEARETPKALVR